MYIFLGDTVYRPHASNRNKQRQNVRKRKKGREKSKKKDSERESFFLSAEERKF